MAGHVDVRFYAELNEFLPLASRGTTMRRPFRSHQTVKDIIEAAGIPHTEVDLIVVDGESVGFSHRPRSGDRLAVYPVFETLDITAVGRLRPAPLRDPRFVVDINLGQLARLLRLVGFDALCDRHLDDPELAAVGAAEHRIVLTRDRGLLKRRTSRTVSSCEPSTRSSRSSRSCVASTCAGDWRHSRDACAAAVH